MARPEAPDPVKLLVAALWAEEAALDRALADLERHEGPIDFAGSDHPFTVTDYYTAEMGPGLRRRIVSFDRLVAPETIVEAKLLSNTIEAAHRVAAGRTVNLDIGYLDLHKLVLASGKYGPQKIHLGQGIHADIICRYMDGEFLPCEWTFPDFRTRLYDHDLAAIRRRYRAQLRERRG